MMLQDVQGHELTGATEEAAADFERGAHELRCFIGDPVASADRAIAGLPALFAGCCRVRSRGQFQLVEHVRQPGVVDRSDP